MSEPTIGKVLKLDGNATSSDPKLPAFLLRPEGAPVYHGFAIVEETCTDGWCYGAITEFLDQADHPDGCDSGDGFVVAPDGSRAGLVWEFDSTEQEVYEIMPPEPDRWGVWGVWFPRPISTIDDLVFNFRHVLPALQQKYRDFQEHTDGSHS